MLELIKAYTTDRLFEDRQAGAIEGQYYVRTGSCNQCGQCCTGIYLVHNEQPIKSTAEFEVLKEENPEYQLFRPVDEDEHGVRFECNYLSPERICTIYENRPTFCRKYPSEKGMLLGGQLATGCGYRFEVKTPFADVLAKTAAQKRSKSGKLPGKLLS